MSSDISNRKPTLQLQSHFVRFTPEVGHQVFCVATDGVSLDLVATFSFGPKAVEYVKIMNALPRDIERLGEWVETIIDDMGNAASHGKAMDMALLTCKLLSLKFETTTAAQVAAILDGLLKIGSDPDRQTVQAYAKRLPVAGTDREGRQHG